MWVHVHTSSNIFNDQFFVSPTWIFSTLNVKPPITDEVILVEDGSVGTEKRVHFLISRAYVKSLTPGIDISIKSWKELAVAASTCNLHGYPTHNKLHSFTTYILLLLLLKQEISYIVLLTLCNEWMNEWSVYKLFPVTRLSILSLHLELRPLVGTVV